MKQMQDTGSCPEDHGVRIGVSSFLCVFFLLILAMASAFLGGVMLGRENPIRDLPSAALKKDASDSAGRGADEEKEGRGAQEAAQGVLAPEEFSYALSLRSAPGDRQPQRPQSPMVPAVANDENGAPRMAPGMSPAVVEGPPQPPAERPEAYDFTLQVAAYKTQAQAERQRLPLDAKGYRTRVEKAGKSLYVVLLFVRGSLERYDEVRRDMQAMGLGVPMERARKPVFLPASRRR